MDDEQAKMLIEQLKSSISEKDQIIADLRTQIGNLSNQIQQQSTQLTNQTNNIAKLTEQVGLLTKNANDFPPIGTGKKRTRTGSAVYGESNLTSANTGAQNKTIKSYFTAGLSSNESPMDQDSNENTNQNENNNATNSGGSNGTTSFANVAARPKSKPTPIQLGHYSKADSNKIVALLAGEFEDNEYEWNQFKPTAAPKIFVDNLEIKAKITDFLDNNDIEYNTYTEKSDKRSSFLVRGLNYGIDSANCTFIRDAMAHIGITGDISVSRFITGFMKRNQTDEQTIIYRLTVGSNVNLTELAKIKNINGFRVSFETMKKSTVIQCHRCQRFQHTANQCKFKYRCVQCITEHAPGACPRLSNKQLPVKCVNCHSTGVKNCDHTANNLKSCEFFHKFHSNLFNKFQRAVQKPTKQNDDTTNNNSTNNRPTSNDIIQPTASNNGTKTKGKRSKRVINLLIIIDPVSKQTNKVKIIPANIVTFLVHLL